MSDIVIEVNNVSMKSNLSREKIDSLKEYIIKRIKKKLLMMSSGPFRELI